MLGSNLTYNLSSYSSVNTKGSDTFNYVTQLQRVSRFVSFRVKRPVVSLTCVIQLGVAGSDERL